MNEWKNYTQFQAINRLHGDNIVLPN